MWNGTWDVSERPSGAGRKRGSTVFMQQTEQEMNNIQYLWDFPGGPVVKNLPRKAGDVGFDPWSGN